MDPSPLVVKPVADSSVGLGGNEAGSTVSSVSLVLPLVDPCTSVSTAAVVDDVVVIVVVVVCISGLLVEAEACPVVGVGPLDSAVDWVLLVPALLAVVSG